MNKKIKFSFGTGLKGNVSNKFDFNTLFEIFDKNKSNILHTQTEPMIDLNSINGLDEKIFIKVTQSRNNFFCDKEYEFEIEENESSSNTSYLKMFIATPGEIEYIDPNTIVIEPVYSNYWHQVYNNTEFPLNFGNDINKRFIDGARQITSSIETNLKNSSGSSVIVTQPTINNHNKYIFKLAQDVSKKNLILSELEGNLTNCMINLQNIGISNDLDKLSIYMTYKLSIPCFFFNSFTNNFNTASYGNNVLQSMEKLVDFFDKQLAFTCNWFHWEDNKTNYAGWCWGGTGPYGTFHSVISIEPGSGSWHFNSANSVFWPNQWRHTSTATNVTQHVNLYTQVNLGAADLFRVNYKPNWLTSDIENYSAVISTLVHELGHAIDNYSPEVTGIKKLSALDEWTNLWWKAKGIETTPGERWSNGFVRDFKSEFSSSTLEPPITPYACTNNAEDFAEAYTCYQMNPQYMQAQYPKRYAFMQKWIPQIRAANN